MDHSKRVCIVGFGLLAVVSLIMVSCVEINSSARSNDDRSTEADTVSVPGIAPGMEILIAPKRFLGLGTPSHVDPDQPGGGIRVEVREVDLPGRIEIAWHRTVTEEVLTDDEKVVVGIGTPEPSPEVELVRQEGVISASGMNDARQLSLPFHWLPDMTESESSLLWLSREAFSELRETRRTDWTPDVLTRLAILPIEVLEQIQNEALIREIELTAEGEFSQGSVLVDGNEIAVQTIIAHDDFGNKYVILDDPANPMIIEFTYDALSGGGVYGLDSALWLAIKAIAPGYEVREINTH